MGCGASALCAFAGSRDRTAVDTVRAEHSASNNGCGITVVQDLRKCYEMVAHAQLWMQAGTLRNPLSILRLSLQSCRWPRRMQVGDVVSDLLVLNKRGRVRVRHHELRPLLSISYHLTAFPCVQSAVFVGDCGFDFCGDDEREARTAPVGSIAELERGLVEDLQLALAQDKTLVVASSRALATSVARDLRVPTSGVVTTSAEGNGTAGLLLSVRRGSPEPHAGWGASHISASVRAKEEAKCSWLESSRQSCSGSRASRQPTSSRCGLRLRSHSGSVARCARWT